MNITDLDQYKAPKGWAPDAEYPSMMRTFYSPIDDVHGVLKEIIGSCRRSIVIRVGGR
jgi:hypothetical protein